MIRVVIESPYGSEDPTIVQRNIEYLRRCILDSLGREEAPFASHGLYPQVLNDQDPFERELGIKAGFVWGSVANFVAVYKDYEVSKGMMRGIMHAHRHKIPIENRRIGKNPNKEVSHAKGWKNVLRRIGENVSRHREETRAKHDV